jgi:hypothetical protein
MTYSSGGLIQATDYNGFVSTTAGANVNATWSTGTTDGGWGQTAISTVSTGGTVTATQWATLVNTLSSMGSQTGTAITARSAPTAGTTISILAAVNTDLTNCYNNRANAAAVGSTSTTWTGSAAKTSGTGTGTNAWTITFTSTVTFPSADQARYFFNAGGRIYLNMSKTSTGTDSDPDWNTFVGKMPTFNITGISGSKTLAGTAYTGWTTTGGNLTGLTLTLNDSTKGWYSLTAGAAATNVFVVSQANPGTYANDQIYVQLAKNAGSTALTITTVMSSGTRSGAGQSTNISGGTDTASPFSAFGTAPAVVCRFVPPATTYLSNSWGTPTVASSVA